MNKSFRYIISTAAISVVVLTTALNTTAQNLKEGTYEEKNGIAYSKSATLQPDGSYVIDLEAFVTGEVKITTKSMPSDIILVLDVSSSMKNNNYGSITRLQALKNSVNSFLETIYKNDQDAREIDPSYDGNRIAILTYSSTVTDVTTQSWYSVSGGVESLKTKVNALGTNQGTRPELGLSNAIDKYLDGTPNTARSNATLAVVLFTDGYPTDGNATHTYGSGQDKGAFFDYTYANNTIYQAHILKDTYKANLFTVGLITEVSPTNNVQYANYSRVLYLLDLVSSNYPDATIGENNQSEWPFTYDTHTITVNDLTTGDKIKDGKFFQLVDDNTDLSSIFKSIADQSGGSATTIPEGSVVTVDVVSASFAVPTGGSDAIEVLYAPTNGTTTIDGKEYLTFGEAKTPSECGLSGITVTVDEETNTVKTSGFDLSKNWCGKDESSSTGFHGYKQIIRFTITVLDSAVGGPNVYTNDAGSGIYVDGTQVATFNRPSVKIPVNIWIQKQGLVGEDSAVFTLARARYVAGQTPADDDWVNFTKVVVNKESMDENGLVKISGLDPDYYYRLKEDAWAWGYKYQDGGILYTIGDNVQNPFVFVNIPKDTKKAEAVVRNVFEKKTTE